MENEWQHLRDELDKLTPKERRDQRGDAFVSAIESPYENSINPAYRRIIVENLIKHHPWIEQTLLDIRKDQNTPVPGTEQFNSRRDYVNQPLSQEEIDNYEEEKIKQGKIDAYKNSIREVPGWWRQAEIDRWYFDNMFPETPK